MVGAATHVRNLPPPSGAESVLLFVKLAFCLYADEAELGPPEHTEVTRSGLISLGCSVALKLDFNDRN